MLVNGLSSVVWGAINDKLGVVGTTSTGAALLCTFLLVTSYGRSSTHFYWSIPATGFAEAAISPGIILGAVGRMFTDKKVRSKALGICSAIQGSGRSNPHPTLATENLLGNT